MSATRRIEFDLTSQEIDQLREAMDALPLRPYAPLIVKVLKALPIESAAVRSGADSAPAPLESREVAGGFRLTAYTPRGVSMLEALDRVLGKLPHGGSL